jgi:hypothetical protein
LANIDARGEGAVGLLTPVVSQERTTTLDGSKNEQKKEAELVMMVLRQSLGDRLLPTGQAEFD